MGLQWAPLLVVFKVQQDFLLGIYLQKWVKQTLLGKFSKTFVVGGFTVTRNGSVPIRSLPGGSVESRYNPTGSVCRLSRQNLLLEDAPKNVDWGLYPPCVFLRALILHHILLCELLSIPDAGKDHPHPGSCRHG